MPLHLGDNIRRKTGDTLGFENLNTHAYDAYQKGQEIHMQAGAYTRSR